MVIPKKAMLWCAIALSMIFATLVSFAVHGYSVGGFDGIAVQKTEKHKFPQVGKPQPFRSDEFMVSLPLVAAQCRAKTFFPVFNGECFARPTDMFVMTPPCPVFDWTVPGQFPNWGYFLFGLERGMAWNWWSRYLLVPTLSFIFFMLCTKSFFLSVVAAFSISLGAPTQWWTTTMPYHLAFMFGSLLSVWGIMNSARLRGIVISALCLFISAASFFFTFYPPFQYPLLILFATLLPLLPSKGTERERHRRWRHIAVVAVFILLVAEFCYFGYCHEDTLKAISKSVYPGRRCAIGGPFQEGLSFSLFKFISLFDTFCAPGRTNPCVCAMFFVPFLPVAAESIQQLIIGLRKRRCMRAFPLAAFCVFLALWTFFPLPEWVGQATFFKIVPAARSAVILSLALLVSMFLEYGTGNKDGCLIPWSIAVIVVLGSTLLCGVLCLREGPLRDYFQSPLLPNGEKLLAVGLVIYAAMSLGLLRRMPWLFYPSCVAAAILSGCFVNPLCAGAAPLTEKKLSRIAASIESEHGPGTWVSSNEYTSQFLVANGFRSLGGVMSQPRPDIWMTIDPLLNQSKVWNRYAHVQAEVTKICNSDVRLLNEAKFIWNLSVRDAIALGARYLVDPAEQKLPDEAKFLCEADGHSIWLLDSSTVDSGEFNYPIADAPFTIREDMNRGDKAYIMPCGIDLVDACVLTSSATGAVVRTTLRFKSSYTTDSIPACIAIGVANAAGKVLYECQASSLCGLQQLAGTLGGKVVDIDISGAIPPDFVSLNPKKFAIVFYDAMSGKRLAGRDATGKKIRRIPVRNCP